VGGSAGVSASAISVIGGRRGWPKAVTFVAIVAAIAAVIAIVNLFWPRGS
jgi:hypothetical protein